MVTKADTPHSNDQIIHHISTKWNDNRYQQLDILTKDEGVIFLTASFHEELRVKKSVKIQPLTDAAANTLIISRKRELFFFNQKVSKL